VEDLTIFILLVLLAEILGTVGGFGSSLFFVPIAGYFLDFHSALGITALFHVSSNLTKIVLFRNGFDKKLLLTLGLPAVAFVVFGAFASKWFDSKILEIALGLFLIVVSLVLLVFKNLSLTPTVPNAIAGGALSGLTAGLLGTGGAIRGITLAAYNLRMEVFIATSAFIDLGVDASRSVVYYYNGYFYKDMMYLIPTLFFVSVAGTYIGKKILGKISEESFKTIVLALILVAGIFTFIRTAFFPA
jgi:uncharacterized membrane protein YfcA